MRTYPKFDKHGRPRTPWAIWCRDSDPEFSHNLVYLTKDEYDRQMNAPDSLWKCPICRCSADWDDDNYEQKSR